MFLCVCEREKREREKERERERGREGKRERERESEQAREKDKVLLFFCHFFGVAHNCGEVGGKFSGDILVVNVSKVWMTVNTAKNPSTLLSGIFANASPLRRKSCIELWLSSITPPQDSVTVHCYWTLRDALPVNDQLRQSNTVLVVPSCEDGIIIYAKLL